MSNGSTTQQLQRAERLARLEAKIDNLHQMVERLNASVFPRREHDAWERRIIRNECDVEDHEKRLVRVERVVWLEAAVFALFGVPVILMLIFEFLGRLF